jgi:hypothetical protein
LGFFGYGVFGVVCYISNALTALELEKIVAGDDDV